MPRWVWLVLVTAAVLVGFYFAAAGFPTTPMTTARAYDLFGHGVVPGQSRSEVEAWLAKAGILPNSAARTGRTSYEILLRSEDVTFKGWWMDCYGKQTVAECAGLDVDSVYSVVRVTYPDAARTPFGVGEVRVYLFFDSGEKLIRCWVNEFWWSL